MPTVVRQQMSGYLDSIGSIGGTFSPYLSVWSQSKIVIPIVCFLITQLMWFLPSTINTPLADTLEEAEERKSELVKLINKQKNDK